MYRRPAMAKWLRQPTAPPVGLGGMFRLGPPVLLAAVCVLSLAARVAWIGEPCHDPCRANADHLLVFDESYYVNAARVIAGIPPPANQTYASAPLGDDPNAEHPQLAKLLDAGSIELFGDNPFGWRLPTLLLGTIAILGIYALVRAAGGSSWVALLAAALMAADNLLLIHGRIETLDVPVLAPMIWGAVLYLRGHPVLAGVLIGVASTVKLVAPYMLLVLVLVELLRWLGSTREWRTPVSRAVVRLGACAAAWGAVFLGLLAILDRIAPPFNNATGRRLASGPFHHIAHMLSYGADQTSPHGPIGIASYPWAWLIDLKPITYLNVNPAKPAPGLYNIHPAVHFLGMISPPIMLLALPALALGAYATIRGRRTSRRLDRGEVPLVAIAWFLGTFLPFLVLSVALRRTSYLYYMVIVMPAIYMAVADLVVRGRRYKRLMLLWGLLVLAAAIVMYPLTPLP
jgi:4-amino-4-deoxy-L-arabinose transferase-like glycosyltransferase